MFHIIFTASAIKLDYIENKRRIMKFLHLIWKNVNRQKVQSKLTLASVFVAFMIYVLLSLVLLLSEAVLESALLGVIWDIEWMLAIPAPPFRRSSTSTASLSRIVNT